MWILKGRFLGIWLCSFGTLAYLYLLLFRKASGGVVDARLITQFTTHSPVWWIALVLCLAIGLFVSHSWFGRPILWVALAVTELLPVGLFVLFLVLVSRNHEAVQKIQNMK